MPKQGNKKREAQLCAKAGSDRSRSSRNGSDTDASEKTDRSSVAAPASPWTTGLSQAEADSRIDPLVDNDAWAKTRWGANGCKSQERALFQLGSQVVASQPPAAQPGIGYSPSSPAPSPVDVSSASLALSPMDVAATPAASSCPLVPSEAVSEIVNSFGQQRQGDAA